MKFLPPHFLPPQFLSLMLLLLGLSLAPHLHAAAADGAGLYPGLGALTERFPQGSIQTPERAEQALDDVGEARAQVNANHAQQAQLCYRKFFSTRCLEKLKESQRLTLNALQAIEVEANAYQRRKRAEDRDALIAERRAEEEAQAPLRLQQEREREEAAARKVAEHERRAEQDRLDAQRRSAKEQQAYQREALPPPTPPAAPSSHSRNPLPDALDPRVKAHQDKRGKAQAEEDARVPERAENIRKYQEKVEKSEERQRLLQQRKAEKEQQRLEKSAR